MISQFIVTVHHAKHIPKLASRIEKRIWTIAYVDNSPGSPDVTVDPVDKDYASTTMELVEQYAKAVHDGDDAAAKILCEVIKASLEQGPVACELKSCEPEQWGSA